MALASTIIGAVGDLLVLIALVVAVKALKTANATRCDATQAEKAASEARLQAAEQEQVAADRAMARDQEAFLERQHERLLSVGQLVETIFWAVEPYTKQDVAAAEVPKDIWMPARNALRHRLIGLKSPLHSCEQIINTGAAYQAFEACTAVRQEVEVELQRIDSELEALYAAFRVHFGGLDAS